MRSLFFYILSIYLTCVANTTFAESLDATAAPTNDYNHNYKNEDWFKDRKCLRNTIPEEPFDTPGSEIKFHLATTDAEKKLEYILHSPDDYDHDDNWYDMLSYIQKRPHSHPKMKLRYQHLFTKDFIYAWSKKEQEEIEKTCGYYNYQDLCSFNMVVLTCAQDCHDKYFFRTIKDYDDTATVQYALSTTQKFGSVAYRLVKRNNIWLLDGLIRKRGTSDFSINFDLMNQYSNNNRP